MGEAGALWARLRHTAGRRLEGEMRSPGAAAGRRRECGPAPEARRRATLVLSLLFLAQTCPAVEADDNPQAQLEEIRARIEAVGARLEKARTAYDRSTAQLREVEVAIGRAAARLREIEQALEAKRDELGRLQDERDALAERLRAHTDALARQVRVAYMMGRQDYLKLLLNQQDPAMLARALAYHRYFHRARARRIEALQDELARIKKVRRAIRTQAAALERLEAEKRQAHASLVRRREERAALVGELNERISREGERLERLREDESRLEQLVEELRQELADIPAALDSRAPFPALRGRLPWPSAGAVRHDFGKSREGGELAWRGVWIAASAGSPVRAVSHGRVAYADWFRGLGLLLIIDHGEGYMTLYGHNQTIYKEVGDWVEGGERIASVGASGGAARPGLYFEIRHQGRPQDPEEWCRGGGPPEEAALVTPP